MTIGGLDDDVESFIDVAAHASGRSVSDLLRAVLHIDVLTSDVRFHKIFEKASPAVVDITRLLDHRLQVWNPGCHYAFKAEYMGYRREDSVSKQLGSVRSAFFLTLVPRQEKLVALLPLEPEPYLKYANCKSLVGLGHQGVGDLSYSISSERELKEFLSRFEHWLRPNLTT